MGYLEQKLLKCIMAMLRIEELKADFATDSFNLK